MELAYLLNPIKDENRIKSSFYPFKARCINTFNFFQCESYFNICVSRILFFLSLWRPEKVKKHQPASMSNYFLVVLFTLMPSFLSAQLVSSFTADVTSGCSPVSVSFNNLSESPEGTTFLWDFGNGNTSTAKNPQATYVAVGSYTVSLTITFNNVTDIMVREAYIVVNAQPVVNFELSGVDEGCAPLSSVFINHSSDPAGAPLTYLWSFGDGYKSSEEHPSHLYQSGGIYDVTLMATSAQGCASASTQQALITVYQPQAKFGVDKTYSCNGTLESQFNNLSEGGPGLSYLWNFGDGSTSDEESPSHLYNGVGNYSVELIITNSFGCESKLLLKNLIQIVKTSAGFSASKDTVCPGEIITFTNSSVNANTYLWKWGDGTTDRFRNTFKSYSQPADYDVWLIVSNGTCTDSVSKKVNVELVQAGFAVSDTFLCQLPKSVSYTNQSINAVSWDWKFGNGVRSTAQNPAVNFSDVIKLTNDMAVFSDTLIVTSKHGCKSQMIKRNSVTVHIPTVKLAPGASYNPKLLSGCIPFALRLSDSTKYNTTADYIVQRSWQLGNEAVVNAEHFDVALNTPGVYPVKLILVTNKGCVFTGTEKLSVGEVVSPDFRVVGSSQVCASTPVSFEITSPSADKITSSVWDFGDGDKGGLPHPPHYYIKTGDMNVKLTVYNYGCSSTVTKNSVVKILGPIGDFRKIVNCDDPLSYGFAAQIQDATSYQWNFGDGSPVVGNQLTPEHRYASKDQYTVNLSMTNSQTGCNYTATQLVTIKEPTARIIAAGNLPCPGQAMVFDGSSSTDADLFTIGGVTRKYLWKHLETGNQIFSDNPVSLTFSTKGTQHISLIVRDVNGCFDTAMHVVDIYRPEPKFDVTYQGGCLPVNYLFEDKSESPIAITNWQWSFGDGNSSTLQNPLHGYTDFGKYNISLEVTDSKGCKNKLVSNQLVQAIEPDARFTAVDSTLCIGNTTTFRSISNSNIISYLWEFSDGFQSTDPQPSRVFPNAGNYTVKLSIVDDHNCHTDLTKPDFVKVQSYPVADFSSDALVSNCYPFVVQFADNSTGNNITRWRWNFGDNTNTSNLQNPFYIYNRPGKHNVSLITYTSFGCSDTIVKPEYINVGGPFAVIDVRDTVCRDVDVNFKTSSLINVHDMRWDFGDGYSALGDNVLHKYTNSGLIYPVLFLRTDAENTCNKAIVDTLMVLHQVAKFRTEDNLYSGCLPVNAKFVDQSINATSWLWNFGDGTTSQEQNPLHDYNNPGSFEVILTIMHEIGCTETYNGGNIEVFPLPEVISSPDTIICRGTPVSLRASGGIGYQWTPVETIENPMEANTNAHPLQNTQFSVTVTDENYCSDSANVNVYVQQPLQVLLRDTSIIIGETYRPDIYDAAVRDYLWQPSETVSCSTCPNPVLFPLISTQYEIFVTDTTDCFTIMHPFNLTVIEKYSVDVPDAFSPNGDGVNDQIFVRGWGIKELMYFRVFNRFGQLLFESNDLSQGWDGSFKGVIQPLETYSYTLAVKTYAGTILVKNGSFKIVQ
jgi:gliding motility-associated-like protein